jgi:DNA-binding transcriptional regulator YiaG
MDISVKMPKAKRYPAQPKTLGEHIRKIRMDKKLPRRKAAEVLGVTGHCVKNWENNLVMPQTRYFPSIIAFLGYDPSLPNIEVLAKNIRQYRRQSGMTQEALAKIIGVTVDTISGWENAESRPIPSHMTKLLELLNSN